MTADEETVSQYAKRMKWRYDSVEFRRTPPTDGRILVHNFGAPENLQRTHGDGGFRVWTQLPDKKLSPCSCGWRPDLGAHFTSHTMTKSRMVGIRRKAKREGYYIGPPSK
jgi:hypothetical protein